MAVLRPGRPTWKSVLLAGLGTLCTYALLRLHSQRNDVHFLVYEPSHGPWEANTHSLSGDVPSKEAQSIAHEVNITQTEVALVVASLSSENTTWIESELHSNWTKLIYVVDDPHSPLRVPVNKGRESMVYLTYIIDHYDSLPAYSLFIHAGRYQWHNDDPDYDGLALLRRIQLAHLRAQGYVNLRCTWTLGCPVEIRPVADEGQTAEQYKATAAAYKRAYQQLLPGAAVPEQVGQSCCAQFGATRQAIRARPLADYLRMRDWLVDTTLDDAVSGRIFEYLWHIIFHKPAVFCPDARDCYCSLFGLCGLECGGGECKGRYALPPYTTLPTGWPKVGWDGLAREPADVL